MKKRNQEKIVKIFCFVIILIMVFQVMLPLFSSVDLNNRSTAANTIDQTEVTTTTPAAVTTTTSPETKPVIKK